MLQEVRIRLIEAQGAEKRGFGFPDRMRFREQIGMQFVGWNVRLEAIGKRHRCFYTSPALPQEYCMPND